jgi:hypothetical protein
MKKIKISILEKYFLLKFEEMGIEPIQVLNAKKKYSFKKLT